MSTVQGGPGNIVTNGLVLYLDAANTKSYVSGSTVWNDLSINGNKSTLINGPTYNSANGGSIVFDGNNEFASIVNQSPILTPTFTICSFVNPLSFNNNGTVIFTREYARLNLGMAYAGNRGAYFFVRGSNYSSTGNELNGVQQFFDFKINTWYHTTFIVDIPGNNYKMYVNGTQIWSSNIVLGSDFLDPGYPGVIASRYNGTSVYSNIEIANFSFYNRVLSATEILQNYNATRSRFRI
jgi:hypothetical protein